MPNTSGIIPVGDTILVLPDQIESKSASGIITSTEKETDRLELGQTDGEVIAVSPDAWSDHDKKWAKVGDRVIFAKYTGMVREGKDGKRYRLVNDEDIKAVLQ